MSLWPAELVTLFVQPQRLELRRDRIADAWPPRRRFAHLLGRAAPGVPVAEPLHRAAVELAVALPCTGATAVNDIDAATVAAQLHGALDRLLAEPRPARAVVQVILSDALVRQRIARLDEGNPVAWSPGRLAELAERLLADGTAAPGAVAWTLQERGMRLWAQAIDPLVLAPLQAALRAHGLTELFVGSAAALLAARLPAAATAATEPTLLLVHDTAALTIVRCDAAGPLEIQTRHLTAPPVGAPLEHPFVHGFLARRGLSTAGRRWFVGSAQDGMMQDLTLAPAPAEVADAH